MCIGPFPVINMKATGSRIQSLRKERGLSVRDIQEFFHFEEPRAIYKCLNGQSIPSVDNLLALCTLFQVHMEDILVYNMIAVSIGSREESRDPAFFLCRPFPPAYFFAVSPASHPAV